MEIAFCIIRKSYFYKIDSTKFPSKEEKSENSKLCKRIHFISQHITPARLKAIRDILL